MQQKSPPAKTTRSVSALVVEREREADRQRERDRQTDRERERQTDRVRQRQRERE